MKSSSATAALATALVTAALALTGCGTTHSAAGSAAGTTAAQAPSAPAGPITLTDTTGTQVTLDRPARTVVATEWNAVEDLVALGVAPAGVADVKGYRAWDTAAPLTGAPKDIGMRGEPSMDTIAALAPDLVVATTDLPASAVTQLRKIAPVLVVRSADATDQLGLMAKDLDLIAQATGKTAQAAAVKSAFDAKLAAGGAALKAAGKSGASYAFGDAYVVSNQVSIRAYTGGSLVGAVNERLGLKNAWTVKGDKDYGLATTDVEGVTGLGDTQFAYIANKVDGDPFADNLAKNAVWKAQPFVKAGHVHRLPDGIWMFGGPLAMGAYVDAVVDALTK